MGEFSELIGIRNEYYEYTDEVCEIIKNETTAINEAYLADFLKDKLIASLDNEYPLTSLIVLRITLNEIMDLITDRSNVNIRQDVSDKIVSNVTGKSAIMTYYSKDPDDVKRRRTMMKMIDNYMYSMYMSSADEHLPLIEQGLKKSLFTFQKEEDKIKEINVTSHNTGNPSQGVIFTITIQIE